MFPHKFDRIRRTTTATMERTQTKSAAEGTPGMYSDERNTHSLLAEFILLREFLVVNFIIFTPHFFTGKTFLVTQYGIIIYPFLFITFSN